MIRKLFIILFIVAFGYGCQKDDHTELPNCKCTERPSLVISYFSEGRFQYKSPFYNPNDANEFCYYYKDNLEQDYALMKYNLLTKESVQLASNVRIASKPAWSRKGWIAYDRIEDAQIWGVKDNSDSLTQITEYSSNFYPRWDAQGDYLYFRHSPVNAIPYYFFKQEFQSEIVDTLLRDGDIHNGYVRFNSVDNLNLMVAQTYYNGNNVIGLFDLNEGVGNFRELVDIENADWAGLTDITIDPNGDKAYVAIYLYGIFEIDTTSGIYHKIMNFCWDRRYRKISISPDGKTLIGERIDSYLELYANGNPTGNFVENSSIYLIDLLTMEETKIDIEL